MNRQQTENAKTYIYFRNRPETPIGRIQTAGYVHDTWRHCTWPVRLLGTYGMIYVTEGGGRYHDTLGSDVEVRPGDLILLFPDVPHSYGPRPGGQWSEIYAHFDGPAFDLWRQRGLLDPAKPVHHQEQTADWRAELEAVLRDNPVENEAGQMIQVSRFLALLTRMMVEGALVRNDSDMPRWLQTSLAFLDTNFENDIPLPQIAFQAGLPYHTFRKRFEQAMGLAPAHYRVARRMEAACSMLLHTKLRVREIAESLNFNDEFHFSNRFLMHTGMRPSKYRREGRRGTPPPSPVTIPASYPTTRPYLPDAPGEPGPPAGESVISPSE